MYVSHVYRGAFGIAKWAFLCNRSGIIRISDIPISFLEALDAGESSRVVFFFCFCIFLIKKKRGSQVRLLSRLT